ncbi:DUF4168 domain-containing protein [Desulfonatronospira sp.]|uniref:DUF4168 domain-containing protein n=1 Tax=Desulfonatronospira sp. TaxID=1962951 RepID=UPI0025BF458C|nr:DUF4168 domain-containing protein [Desulfonatronospira sp.]
MYQKTGLKVFGLAVVIMFVLGMAFKVGAQQEYQPDQQQQQQQQEYQPDQQQQQEMMQQQAPEVNLSDAELDKVAEAYEAVTEVREEFQADLEGIEDPEQAQEMQEEAGEKMVEAVENQGLDVETYNQAMEAAQVDEDLRNELLDRLDMEQAY